MSWTIWGVSGNLRRLRQLEASHESKLGSTDNHKKINSIAVYRLCCPGKRLAAFATSSWFFSPRQHSSCLGRSWEVFCGRAKDCCFFLPILEFVCGLPWRGVKREPTPNATTTLAVSMHSDPNYVCLIGWAAVDIYTWCFTPSQPSATGHSYQGKTKMYSYHK